MRQHLLPLLAVAAMAVLPPWLAHADATTEAELRQALQTSTAQIATLEDEVAHLQAAQAPQTALVKSLQAALQAQKTQPEPASTTETAAQRAIVAQRVSALDRQLAARTADLDRSRTAYLKADDMASASAAQNTQLTAQGAALRTQIMACDKKNAALYQLATQILNAYAHKDDILGTIAGREPFTGLKRVQLQNIVQDDQDRLFDEQVNPAQPGP